MVVEADHLGCVREVLVIAAALSIQDVRERPQDAPERAAELHRRFDVEGSDLLSLVALWDHLRERQRSLSGNQFRRTCREEYLHYLRVREWRDLYSQLRQVAGQLGIRPGVDAAHPDHVHRAVLAGLLSQIGVRDGEGREFRGARDARFVIARGSVLARRPPRWVMAAELVETDRLRARRVATIQPEWAEPLSAHVAKRSYGDPWWDARSGRAVTTETVMLYGLPIVSARTIGLDRVDPASAREMFVRHALVAGDWDTRHAFVERNERFVERVRLLEARVRRIDLLDDDALFEFYDRRVGPDVTSARHFDRWWRDARERDPDLLDLTPAVLSGRRGIDLDDYPDAWTRGDVGYRLSYRFEPDTPLDGAAVVVPVTELNQIDDEGFDWSIPGYRRELVSQLLRTLPKEIRRELVPMAEYALEAYRRLGPPRGRLVDALAAVLSDLSGRRISADDLDPGRLPTNLRLHIVVVDADGTVVDAGDDLGAIRARQAATTRSALAAAMPVVERRDIVRWDIGTLERVVEQPADGGRVVRAYPTLLDRGDSVALRVVDNEDLQERAMRGGVRRLLLMAAAPTPAKVERALDQRARLAVAASSIPLVDLTAECIEAAVDAVMSRFELPWDGTAFARLEAAVGKETPQLASDSLAEAADILAAADRVRRRAGALTAEALRPTVADATAHLDRLIAPGFVRRAGTDRLPDVHRYVRGIEYRLDHLAGDIHRDRRRMADVRPLERSYATAVDRLERVTDGVRAVAWLLEEYRVSVFAQPVGVHGPVSPKRIRHEFERTAGVALE
jgi:ATP-dependent helicase HrpA